MTDKEIRKLTIARLMENTDIVSLSVVYYFSAVVLVALIEGAFTLLVRLVTDRRFMAFGFIRGLGMGTNLLLLVVRLVIYFIMLTLISSGLTRYYINMNDSADSGRFVSMHWGRLLSPCLKGSLKLLFYKLLVASPLLLGVYGVLYFRNKGRSVELTILDLMCFMLCIGFTLVWTGEIVHYFTSLSLVKYIIAINPRADFFDACDLSVKLMDGKHSRVYSFTMALVPYALPGLLVYPLVIIFPFVFEARLLFAKEIMGSYWQDKIPAMARRWERQQARLKRQRF